jgi:hypothetical protein
MFHPLKIIFVASLVIGSLPVASPAKADASCGAVHKQTREPIDGQRFWPLAEHGGRAFLDKRTCLVASMKVEAEPVSLDAAMQRCAMMGQGGPRGDMGWQLPTMSELTSLDGEEWQREPIGSSALPPALRSDTAYWTVTEWPGVAKRYAAVTFSGRTTLVRPFSETDKAGVWCVQGARAAALE